MLVRLDPDARRDDGAVDPARPARSTQIPGARHRRKINADLRRRRRRPDARKVDQTACCGIPINHVINIDFGGFRRAVDAIGCVYVDVDRHYYNSNLGAVEQYAEIDVAARLPEAVRPARARLRALPPRRQRLRARRAPAGLPAPGASAVRRRRALIARSARSSPKRFGRYMRTDALAAVEGGAPRLLKLVGYSRRATRSAQVRFPVAYETDRRVVRRSPRRARARAGARSEFLVAGRRRSPKAQPAGARRQQRRASAPQGADATCPASTNARPTGRGLRDPARRDRSFPVYYPKLLRRRQYGSYERTRAGSRVPAHLPHQGRARQEARRLPARRRLRGDRRQYYGVQGMTWTRPADPRQPVSDTRTVNGRSCCCTTTASAADWSPGGPRRPSTGSRTRCTERSRTTRCSRSPAR